MSDNPIVAKPSDLINAKSSLQFKVSDVRDAGSKVKSASKMAADALSSVSVLAPAAAEVEGTLGGMETVLGCFENALIRLASGLEKAAEGFQTTDATLSAMFNRMDQSLMSFTGFEEQTVAPPAPAHHHHPWWDTALNYVGAGGLVLAGVGAIVLGGGPEDPVGDAGAALAFKEAYALAA